jgi:Holliday junction DNA helicase RuvA
VIATLQGTLKEKNVGKIVVETGGIGLLLNVSLETFRKLPSPDKPVFLHVYTAVRENEIALFGFFSGRRGSFLRN